MPAYKTLKILKVAGHYATKILKAARFDFCNLIMSLLPKIRNKIMLLRHQDSKSHKGFIANKLHLAVLGVFCVFLAKLTIDSGLIYE